MEKLFRAVDEPIPGDFSRQWVDENRDFVAGWYAKAARIPDPEETRRRVGDAMPELLKIFDIFAHYAGDDPVMIAALAGIDPPPLIPAGCTVRAVRKPEPTMLRNYDFHPEATAGIIMRTQWTGRRVLGMGEGVNGLLDGVNDAGVAAALTFGGRHVYGGGFSIIQIMRYLLEVAESTADAAEILARLPCAWAQNIMVLDASGKALVAELAPDREPLIVEADSVTNHQADVEPRSCSARRLAEAEVCPDDAAGARARFTGPELYMEDVENWMATLYTAEYSPGQGGVAYHWPGSSWSQSIDTFEPGQRRVVYSA